MGVNRLRAVAGLLGFLATIGGVLVFVLPAWAHSGAMGRQAADRTALSTVPFSAGSPWRTALPEHVALDPRSKSIVGDLVSQIHEYYGHVALNTYAYSAPLYTVPVGQRRVNLSYSNCEGYHSVYPGFMDQLKGVPIPTDARPSMGTDQEMVIWQPSTNTEWEFWKATRDRTSGRWSACWGGRIDDVSGTLGIFAHPFGATASGLPLLGFLIRVDELRAGVIRHTINLGVPRARASTFSWPASRTDGWGRYANDPAEGERFRLDPELDLSLFHLTPGALMIARAAQRYGLIVTDQSGATAIQGEDPRPYEVNGAPDPYARFFSGPQYSWLQAIPWQYLQAVAWNYGEHRR